MLTDTTTKALVPFLSLLVNAVMKMMQKLQLTATDLRETKSDSQLSLIFSWISVCFNIELNVSNLEILQVFNIGRVVTISVASLEHPESAATHRVDVRPSIRQELQREDLQNAAIVCKPEAKEAKPQSVLSCDSSHDVN